MSVLPAVPVLEGSRVRLEPLSTTRLQRRLSRESP